MKLTSLKCPYCGASLDVDKEGPVECKFCHNTFFAEEDKVPVTMNTTINNFNSAPPAPGHVQNSGQMGAGAKVVIIVAVALVCFCMFLPLFSSINSGYDYGYSYSPEETTQAPTPETTVPWDYWSSQPDNACVITEAAGSDGVLTDDFSSIAPETMTKITISGAGDLSDISWLSKCTSVKELSISDAAAVTDWSVLTKLSAMETLSISDAPELKDAAFFKNMINIKSITLSGTGITDISVLSKRLAITSLSVTDSDVADWSWITTLTSLKTLTVPEGSELPDTSGMKFLTQIQYK